MYQIQKRPACLAFLLLLLALCSIQSTAAQQCVSPNEDPTLNYCPQVPGHYKYTHSWSYAVGSDSLFCSEKGTMDFNADGTALDHARQRYLLVRQDGSRVTWDFDYYSPSYWYLEDEDFYFSGDSTTFKMECVSKPSNNEDADWYYNYARQCADNVHLYIHRETKFNLAELSRHRLVWSYTYPDGHTDTWGVVR